MRRESAYLDGYAGHAQLLLDRDSDNPAGPRIRKQAQEPRNQRQEVLDPVRARREDDDGDLILRRILLVLKILVGRQERVELGAREEQKISVGFGRPAALGDGADLVAREMPPQVLRQGFIEEKLHRPQKGGALRLPR